MTGGRHGQSPWNSGIQLERYKSAHRPYDVVSDAEWAARVWSYGDCGKRKLHRHFYYGVEALSLRPRQQRGPSRYRRSIRHAKEANLIGREERRPRLGEQLNVIVTVDAPRADAVRAVIGHPEPQHLPVQKIERRRSGAKRSSACPFVVSKFAIGDAVARSPANGH